MKNKRNIISKSTEIIFYNTPTGDITIEVLFQDKNVWLTQKKMAELFGVKVPAISKHLGNIFDTLELKRNSVVSIMETTAADRKTYLTAYYNLDAIIAVGYRVNSEKATQFRIWATKVLKNYIIKGFALDNERLKNGFHFGEDYFEELLEQIREIRASERRFYQKITDLYALSADYDKGSKVTKEFFANVQNKLHWAITGKTAAEIIYSKTDANKKYLGLTTWKNAPRGKILKSDTVIAKNYLNKDHIKELERLVSAYLDLAEDRANRKIMTKMVDWDKFLNQFIELSAHPILDSKGSISKVRAETKALKEYEKYRLKQDEKYISDFDTEVSKYLTGNKKLENKRSAKKNRHSGSSL